MHIFSADLCGWTLGHSPPRDQLCLAAPVDCAALTDTRICNLPALRYLRSRCCVDSPGKFSHDMEAYNRDKGPDLPGVCPFWVRMGGRCRYGLGCRLSSTHTPLDTEMAICPPAEVALPGRTGGAVFATPAAPSSEGNLIAGGGESAVPVGDRAKSEQQLTDPLRDEETGWLSKEVR